MPNIHAVVVNFSFTIVAFFCHYLSVSLTVYLKCTFEVSSESDKRGTMRSLLFIWAFVCLGAGDSARIYRGDEPRGLEFVLSKLDADAFSKAAKQVSILGEGRHICTIHLNMSLLLSRSRQAGGLVYSYGSGH